MTKNISLAALALISAVTVSGASFASSAPARIGDVSVVRIDSLDRNVQQQFNNLTPARMASAQAQMRAIPGLAGQLKKQGVELNNVASIEQFANGGVLVYER
jgi:hypothetical protein